MVRTTLKPSETARIPFDLARRRAVECRGEVLQELDPFFPGCGFFPEARDGDGTEDKRQLVASRASISDRRRLSGTKTVPSSPYLAVASPWHTPWEVWEEMGPPHLDPVRPR